jgi:6-phosphogluconolactonase
MKLKSFFILFLFHGGLLAQEQHLLVGTYTSGKSEGIYVYRFNTGSGETKFESVVKTSNPSFLAVSPDKQFIYSVNENFDSSQKGFTGSIVAFTFDKKNGTLTEINEASSGGKNPCYVSIDKTGKWLFAANYTSGTLGFLEINKDGSLLQLKSVIQHSGSGSNAQRQATPHTHAAFLSANNKYLYVPDLGIDKMMIYRFDAGKGSLQFIDSANSVPGSGPRHVAIHPNRKLLYLIEELSGTVVCYRIKKSKLIFVQRISALQSGFKGLIGSADIHIAPNGKFLYCSNRGESNSISIFTLNKRKGTLHLIGEQPTLGVKPRNFSFDPTGKFLLVANQNSDNIVIFSVDQETGLLTDTGKRINVPNPVCIKWISF